MYLVLSYVQTDCDCDLYNKHECMTHQEPDQLIQIGYTRTSATQTRLRVRDPAMTSIYDRQVRPGLHCPAVFSHRCRYRYRTVVNPFVTLIAFNHRR